jgi:hypothetical protein
MELHKFDYVRIKTAKEFNLWPEQHPDGWNSKGQMDCYLGQWVVILDCDNNRKTFRVEKIVKDKQSRNWIFNYFDIASHSGTVEAAELKIKMEIGL